MSLALDEPLQAPPAPGLGRLIAVTSDPDVDRLLRLAWGERYLRVDPQGDWSAQLARSSTDGLLLDPRAPGMSRLRYRDISGASTVYVLRRRNRPAGITRIHRDVLRGRLRSVGEQPMPGEAAALRVDGFSVLQQRPVSARRWYSADDGPGGFIDRLRAAGARFVVLRWYDDLPALPPGEDLDLLVVDADIPLVERVLAEQPGTEPCDVYSVSGRPGTDFHGMAYLPPAFAQRTVARAELLRGRFPVPDPHDAFLGLAYHVAYHKGLASGVPSRAGAAAAAHVQTADHDYVDVLGRMADSIGLDTPRSLGDIDRLLSDQGLRPSRDTLHRLSAINPWAGQLVAAARGDAPAGLAVFFIRERAVENGAADAITSRIEAEGFTVLAREVLDATARRRVSEAVRGGNWERGPYPVSGGAPAVVIVAVDVMPAEVDRSTRAAWPALDNARLLVKHEIRDWYNAMQLPAEKCNIIHSSDNADEAADYLSAALPRHYDALVEQARTMTRPYRPSATAVRDLSRHSRRARIELLDDGAVRLVRKQFRPGCARFAERERYVGAVLAPACEQLVPLVSSEDDAVVFPYLDDVLDFDRRTPKLLPLRVVREAMTAAEFLFDHGVALIDFTPANVIVTSRRRVHVIDYEFAYRYAEQPASFSASYDIAGPPPGFDGDVPVNAYGLGYVAAWQPYVGLTWSQLRRRARWQQHVLRLRYRVMTSWPQLLRDWAGLTRRRSARHLRRVVRISGVAALFKHG